MSSITSPHASRDITAPPDWQAIHQEVKCPLCDYNLRGLHEPRCPECGYQFDWPSVLDPNKRLHPYLFEHHPERNIRSYVQTLLQHLRPKNFWRMANPRIDCARPESCCIGPSTRWLPSCRLSPRWLRR